MGTWRYRCGVRLAAALTAVLLASGCIGNPDPPDQDKPAAFAQLEAFSARMLQEGAPAVLVSVNNRGNYWSHAGGVRDLDTGEEARVSDPVHIGTITESMVAVSVLKLVEEGRLRLDDQVSTYLPEFGQVLHPPGPVTVRELLSHESGIPDFSIPLLSSGPWETTMGRPLSLEKQLALAAAEPWKGRLAHVFDYSQSDYAALALIVQRLRGQRIGQVLAADINQPLGMEVTRLGNGPPPATMVHGYITVGGNRVDTARAAWLAELPSAGALSTVEEVNGFYAALLQGRLLSRESLDAMKGGFTRYYGFGLRRWNDTCNNRFYYGLSGDIPGYGTIAMTSEDGTRQLALSVAYPPAPPTLEVNPLVYELEDIAEQALNLLC